MITRHRTKCFVFKKNDRAEADKSFSVFTEDFGRVEVLGRAMRKINSKLRSGIDIFYFSEIEFIQGKHHKTLTDTLAIKKFKNEEYGFEGFKFFNQVSDMLDRFLKGQEKDQALFDLLNEVFENLNIKGRQELIYHYFVWNFLALQGYGFQAYNCASCKEKLNPNSVYFCGKIGGILCEKCSVKDKSAQKINSDVVKILRIIFKKDWKTLSKLKITPFSQRLLRDASENAINQFCPS